MTTTRRKEVWVQWIKFCTLVLITCFLLLPIVMIVSNSLKSNSEFMTSSALFPRQPTLSNYASLNAQVPYYTFLRNSVDVSFLSTIFSLIVGACGGYAVSRFKSWWVRRYSMLLLMIQMFPATLMIIPLFITFRVMGLIGTEWPVIIVYVSGQLAFATWMSSGFFDGIPSELEEAAWVDGCSRAGGLFRIVVRLAVPGLIAVGIFTFLQAWNDFFIATVFIHNTNLMTIPVGIQMYVEQYSSQWGSLMAACALAAVPVVILFLFVQRYIVKSTIAGAVKG